MNATSNIACYQGLIKSEMCDRIITSGDALSFDDAEMAGKEASNYGAERRKGQVAFFSHDPEFDFIFDGVRYFTDRANTENWNFDLIGLLPLQYSIYGPDDFLEWHRDTLSAPADPDHPGPPPVRKLSFSLQLSDADDYEGGDFQVRDDDGTVDDDLWTRMRQRGSFIIFPSIVLHRVTKVTGGRRRSLVGWVLGPPSEEDLRYDVR